MFGNKVATKSDSGSESTSQVNLEDNSSLEEFMKTELKQNEDADFPEGGARGWSVAAATAGILFCTFGYVNTFGVFQAYYERHQLASEGPSNISWIGSIQVFLLFAGGLIAGPLFDRIGEKVMYPAIIIYVFSVMMTSLCKEYWQFVLAQGVLGGLSTGFMVSPSMSMVSHYFNKKRGAALGLSIAGSSLGGVILPVALGKMLESSLGFGWSIRIIGFLFLGILAPSGLAVRARLPPRKTRFFLPRAFTEPFYAVLLFASCFCILGGFVPVFYLPSYAISRGMNPELALYLAAIFNAGSIPGRILPGILSDKVGRINMLAAAALVSGIMIFCWPLTESNISIIVFGAFFGFASGAIVSGVSVGLAAAPKDPRDIGTYMGQGMAIVGVAALVSPPINGALLNHYHSYNEVSYFTGALTLLGGSIAIALKLTTPQGLMGKV